MKRYIKNAIMRCILLTALMTVCFSCEDLLEDNLEGNNVSIMAPTDNATIATTTVSFWWERIEGALKYNVQVVSPSFQQVERLWADTIVSDNKLILSLVPGDFEWRIKAINGSSETEFISAAFSIENSLNLINESVILRSPRNGLATNNRQQVFKWNSLYNANDYHFRITDNATGDFLENVTVSETEISYEFLTDGIYEWSVRGQNELSNTNYSSFTLQIDTQRPVAPTLSTPLDNEPVATEKVPFAWSRANDTGSPLYDSLYVFADEQLTDRKLAKKLDKTSHEETLDAGVYYWYVKTGDAAGNVSERSIVFSFTKNY